jgi:hypothetical protein
MHRWSGEMLMHDVGCEETAWMGGRVCPCRCLVSDIGVPLSVCASFRFGELLKHPTALKSLLSRDEFKTMTILPSFNKLITDVNKGTVTDAAVRHLPHST